jgi:CelD/BcsL family acetyltransferase involved in cellulose biosynthesis
MQIEVIESTQDFLRLEHDWRALAEQGASQSVFMTWEWISTWWQAYGGDKQLRVLRAMDDGELLGIAPFYESSVEKLRLRYRSLRLLGDGSFDSDYLDFLSKPGEEARVARAVMEYFRNDYTRWSILFLSEVPARSKHLEVVTRCIEEYGYYESKQVAECPYIELPETWDRYLQTLKPRIRTKTRSITRNLESSFDVRFEICADKKELRAKLESLYDLHSRRWETKGQSGVFLHQKREFYRLMSERFLDIDALRFYSLRIGDQYVAHQFCLAYKGGVFLLQEGFSPDWAEQGVGNVLRAYVIKDCIERKVRIYDFLAGVTQHKLSWGTELNSNLRMAVGKKTLRNWVYFSLPKHVKRVRSTFRSADPDASAEKTS